MSKFLWELGCFGLFAALVGYQIFVPPVTGLANNSDFAYILGKLSICSADREKQDNIYLVTDYFVDPVSCTYDFGLISTEVPLVMAATYLSRPLSGENKLDLRVLAALHMSILLAAFGILLSLTSRAGPGVRYGIPALFILIFSDIAYTCYLNSVYLDAPAYVLLLATSTAAAAACLNPRSVRAMIAYLVFGLALIFAKSQHTVLGFLFAALAIGLAFQPGRRLLRMAWVTIALALAGSAMFMLTQTPNHYKLFALYNVIFSRLTPHNPRPWEVLQELGLGDEDMKLVTSHAYDPKAPVYDDTWSAEFLRRTSFGKLIFFYVRHPDVALTEMNRDLVHEAPILRPTDMANFREKDGYPPRAMATRFSLWSNLRSGLLRVVPYHVLLLYLAPWVVLAAGWKWRWLWSPLLPLALLLSTAGVGEFAMSSLTDALDNSRHLFMFQVISEMMILLVAAGAVELGPELSKVLTLGRLKPVVLRWETACLAVFVAIVGYQIFVPPVMGLADNGEFLKVLGPWSICSDGPDKQAYIVRPQCEYGSGIITMEWPLVGVALGLSRVFLGSGNFDLRFLGALHLLILSIGFAILLRVTRRGPPAMRYAIPVLFILIFSDPAYTSYVNSAYLDAPALVLLIAASAMAVTASFERESWVVTIGYLAACAALIFAKPQHAVLGLVFAALAAVFAWRTGAVRRRVGWLAVAVLLIGSMVTMLSLAPESSSTFALYNVIFHRLGPDSGAPRAMLEEVGLNQSDVPYLNTDSSTPGAPISTAGWADDFLQRTSFGDVALYYLRHPDVPIREMNRDLWRAAPAMAAKFGLWSSLRSLALRIFPYHLLFFYLAPWVALVLAWKYKMSRLRWPLIPLALALSAGGMMEFAMASLTDAVNIARHLFLFHAITELLILSIAAALVDVIKSVRDVS